MKLDLYTLQGRPLRRQYIPIQGVTAHAAALYLSQVVDPGFVSLRNEVQGPFMTSTGDMPRVLVIAAHPSCDSTSTELVEVAVPQDWEAQATAKFDAWVDAQAEHRERQEALALECTALQARMYVQASASLEALGLDMQDVRAKFLDEGKAGNHRPPVFDHPNDPTRIVLLKKGDDGKWGARVEERVEGGSFDDVTYAHGGL